jgi:hypothetical protein
MKPKLQRVEVETTILGDHDLSVERAPRRQLRLQRFDQLGEIAVERLLVAALDE